jgi:hypothetical protein
MTKSYAPKSFGKGLVASLVAAVFLVAVASSFAAETYTTKPFSGVKVNGGTATLTKDGGKRSIKLSADFKVPDTPDPHWQLVDSKGTVYLLDRLPLKDNKVKTEITVPAYVPDVAKVQIWCSYAEALLGEAPFASPVK